MPCLGKTKNGEKGQRNFHAVTWQLPAISRDAGQAAAQINHQYQWEDRFNAIEQENKGVVKSESKYPYSNQERGPTFRVISQISEAQILCFARLYICGSDVQTRDQVKASFFCLHFSAAVQP